MNKEREQRERRLSERERERERQNQRDSLGYQDNEDVRTIHERMKKEDIFEDTKLVKRWYYLRKLKKVTKIRSQK